MQETLDQHSRPLKSLRLSVTDRCNLRCTYCMPEERYSWLKKNLILSFEEITRLVRIYRDLGVDRVRITGGEPLLRQDLPRLIEQLYALGLKEIALTTNGVLLEQHHESLRQAGMSRFTVSLDAVDPKTFEGMAQRNELRRTVAGIRSVAHSPGLKLDSVVLKGKNDGEILPLLDFAYEVGAEIRFIEYMDVGGATRWKGDEVYTQDEMLERIEKARGPVEALPGRGSAPAARFRLSSGQVFGIIASTTRPFCGSCDRLRLTADGQLLTCLYARTGRDVRKLLRSELSDQEISERLSSHWRERNDRGAEHRLTLNRRGPLANVIELQENLHLEMHTRGG